MLKTHFISQSTSLTKYTFGTVIDIDGNYSSANPYVTPVDGYFMVSCAAVKNNYVYGIVNGIGLIQVAGTASYDMCGFNHASLFVRAGTTLRAASNSFSTSGNAAKFYPLT